MKKLFLVLFVSAITILSQSCGSKGGSQPNEEESPELENPEMSENKLLGNLPTIVAEASDIIQSFQEQMQNASQMSNSELEQSMKDIQQAMEESAAEAQEEGNRLIGKKVPVEGNPYDFIKIKEAVIDKVKVNPRDCSVNVNFKFVPEDGYTLDNLPAQGVMYLLLTTEDNHVLLQNMSYGKAGNTGISFSPAEKVSPLRWDGLAKIVLLSEQDWRNIQNLR